MLPIEWVALEIKPVDIGGGLVGAKVTGEEFGASQSGVDFPKLDQCLGETHEVFVGFDERPVHPRDFVILAVSVVIPPLCASGFVPHAQHGDTLA